MKTTKRRGLKIFAEFQKEISLAKELPYWDFFSDCVVLADGTLVSIVQLEGISIESKDVENINLLTENLRVFLNSLPDGWEFTFISDTNSNLDDVINQHENISSKSNPHISWITQNRVDQIKNMIDRCLLINRSLYFVVYRRFSTTDNTNTSFFRSFFKSEQKFQPIMEDRHKKMAMDLKQTMAICIDTLEQIGIKPTILNESQIIDLIYVFLNPQRSEVIKKTPLNKECRGQEFCISEIQKEPKLSHQSPREQLVFSDIIQGYDTIFYDGYHHRVITLKTLPEHTYSAMCSRIQQIPFHHTLYTHIEVPEQSKELSSLQVKRRIAHSMSASVDGRAIDLDSEAQLNSAEEILREVIETGQKVFYFQCTVLIKSKDKEELEQKTKIVLKHFQNLSGAEGLKETIASFKVWKNLLPLGVTNIVRPKRVKCNNLVDFLPIYDSFLGSDVEPVCLFQNRQNSLVKYNPYYSGLINFNSLVTGSSGAGKSFLNNLILLQLMALDPILFVIDVGGSYKKICEFFGGQYIEIEIPDEIKSGKTKRDQKVMNPFHLPDKQKTPNSQKIKFLLAFLETIFADNNKQLTKIQKSTLEETIIDIYKNIYAKESRLPILSDLKTKLEGSKDLEMRQFAKMLYPWTQNRPYGLLFDGENTFDVNSDVVFWDLKSLSNYSDLQAVIVLVITDFILSKINSSSLENNSRPKRILMDECWDILKNGEVNATNFMEYSVRTLRKTGSGITFITQGLSEIMNSSIGEAILTNTDVKFVLKQTGDLREIGKTLRFNKKEISLISSLKRKKGDYSEALMVFGEETSVVKIVPHPIEYWLATSDPKDNSVFEEYRRRNSDKEIAQVIYDLAKNYPVGVK